MKVNLVSCTKPSQYMNATIRTWIHYIEVRTEETTQKEHRAVALACAKAIQEIFPAIRNYVQD